MKEVKLDILGRVCIPKGMREILGWEVNSSVYVSQVEDKVFITGKAPVNTCPVCSQTFSSDYKFCPYCGQYLTDTSKEGIENNGQE